MRLDAWISKHMGMSRDEILRLKQITGLTALFRDIKFGQAWKPVEEEEARKAQEAAQKEEIEEAEEALGEV